MSTRHFCEVCGKEIALRGNNYGASRALFGRTDGHYDGWLVEWTIRREWEGNPADLCADCTRKLAERAIQVT